VLSEGFALAGPVSFFVGDESPITPYFPVSSLSKDLIECREVLVDDEEEEVASWVRVRVPDPWVNKYEDEVMECVGEEEGEGEGEGEGEEPVVVVVELEFDGSCRNLNVGAENRSVGDAKGEG
jgi:hypothetical protein